MSPFQAKADKNHQSVTTGLGAGGITWVQSDAAGAAAWKHLDFEPYGSATIAKATLSKILGQLEKSRGFSVKVVLAPGLAHHWLQTPPLETASLAELHAIAQSRANFLFGNPDGGSWSLSADWDAEQPFLCTCLASSWSPINTAIQAYQHPVVSTSLLKLALSRFHKQLPQNGWAAIAIADMLYIMHRTEGRLSTLRSVRNQAQATPSQTEALAEREWRREMLRTQQFSEELSWLCVTHHGQQKAKSPSFRAIPWAISSKFPQPNLSSPTTTTPDAKTDEATLTLWCALQLLEGDTP